MSCSVLSRRCLAILVWLFVSTGCGVDTPALHQSWRLSLEISPSVTAGEDVEYVLSAVSSEGETRTLDTWSISSDVEPELEWTEERIKPKKARPQIIDARGFLDGVSSELETSEEIAVSPGPANTIALELDARTGSYEVGEEILADVTIKDLWGNETRDSWTLEAEGGDVELAGSSLTFLSDGIYTVTATVTGTDIQDTEGPLIVDSSGPVFTMDFPEHVDTTGASLGRVRGNVVDEVSGLLSATMDGGALPVDDVGDFLVYTDLDFGVNVFNFQAIDGDGNATELVNTVLCGDQLPYEEVVPEGMVVHLGDGAGGLDEITEGLDSEIEAIDITGSLPIEITSSKYDVAIVDVDYRFDGVDINPNEDVLVVTTSLSKVEVDVEGQAKAVFWLDVTGSVNVDAVDVKVKLEPVVSSSGTLGVTVANTSVDIEGLEMDFESSLFDVIESVGLDTVLEDYVTDLLEDQIAAAIEDAVTTQVEAALGSLVLSSTVSVLDRNFQIEGEFERVDVDDDGITVGMDVVITPEIPVESPSIDGSLYAGYLAPSMAGLGGIAAGINLDLMNRILYLSWVGGALDQTLTSEQIGLSTDALALVFPDATSVTFTTEAMLPPIVLPGNMITPLEAQLGALRLIAVDQDDNTLVDITVGAIMDVDLEADEQTLTPSLELVGDPWIEISEVAEQSTGIVNFEALIALLLPQVVDSLAYALQAVTLPTVSGSTLTVERIVPYGDDGGFLTAVGSMDIATD